jgi:hypothetical protein
MLWAKIFILDLGSDCSRVNNKMVAPGVSDFVSLTLSFLQRTFLAVAPEDIGFRNLRKEF